jgi:hypothetical protein
MSPPPERGLGMEIKFYPPPWGDSSPEQFIKVTYIHIPLCVYACMCVYIYIYILFIYIFTKYVYKFVYMIYLLLSQDSH